MRAQLGTERDFSLGKRSLSRLGPLHSQMPICLRAEVTAEASPVDGGSQVDGKEHSPVQRLCSKTASNLRGGGEGLKPTPG